MIVSWFMRFWLCACLLSIHGLWLTVTLASAQAPAVPTSVAGYPSYEPTGLGTTSPPAVTVSTEPSAVLPASSIEASGSIGDVQTIDETGTVVLVEEPDPSFSDLETAAILEEACEVIDGEKVCVPASLLDRMLEPYRAYREEEDYTSYMPGDGDQFGWLTFGNNTWLRKDKDSGWDLSMNLHLLSGPEAVALPPRLYDFEGGYQSKTQLSDWFSYDVGLSVGVYSDFEDSARDGVRFPGHLVGMFHRDDRLDWVFGIEYLDRDDIKLLPVIGFVWHDPAMSGLRIEAVFPRPRIDLQIQRDMRLYWTARLGGGSWDIEMPDDSNEVFTYRDYQILMGIESIDSSKKLSAWEVGFVFSRHIEFRNRPDEVNLDEAFVLRHVTRY
jgi:hypothetical protein